MSLPECGPSTQLGWKAASPAVVVVTVAAAELSGDMGFVFLPGNT